MKWVSVLHGNIEMLVDADTFDEIKEAVKKYVEIGVDKLLILRFGDGGDNYLHIKASVISAFYLSTPEDREKDREHAKARQEERGWSDD